MRPGKIANDALDQALARAGDGVFAVGPEGRVLMWNRAAEKVLGWSAREILGRLCCDVFAGADDRGNRLCYQGCHVMSLVKLGEPVQHFDMQTKTKAGRAVWLDISILQAPSSGPGGPLTIHLFRDVTASKELLRLVHERFKAPSTLPDETMVLTRRELEILPPGRRRQRQGASRAAPRQRGDHPQPRPEHLCQAWSPQPTRSRRVREPARPALACR